MKVVRCLAWSSVGIAALIMVLAIISYFTKHLLLNVGHGVTFIHAVNSFLLLGIVLFIASKQCCCDKCCNKDEKEGK